MNIILNNIYMFKNIKSHIRGVFLFMAMFHKDILAHWDK